MNKAKVGLTALLFITSTAVVWKLHFGSLTELRTRNETAQRQLASLAAENERLSKGLALATLTPQPGAATVPSRELLRLRGEVGVLRRENEELARRVGAEPGTSTVPGQAPEFYSSASWNDAGSASPEAAAETFSWAITTGNHARAGDMLERPEGLSPQQVRELVEGLRGLFSEIEDSRLLFTDAPAADEVTFWYQSRLKNGHTLVSPLTVKQLNGTWRVKLSADK